MFFFSEKSLRKFYKLANWSVRSRHFFFTSLFELNKYLLKTNRLFLELWDFFRKIFNFSKGPPICFLVGAFSLKEKSPTITVRIFFSVDNLTLSGPLLQFVHLFNFEQFSEPGERGLDSRTEP